MDLRQDTLGHFKWHQKLKLWHSDCFLGGTETQNINFWLLEQSMGIISVAVYSVGVTEQIYLINPTALLFEALI